MKFKHTYEMTSITAITKKEKEIVIAELTTLQHDDLSGCYSTQYYLLIADVRHGVQAISGLSTSSGVVMSKPTQVRWLG